MDKFRRKIQDNMIPVRRLMEEMESMGCTLDETTDPYNQAMLSTSRAANDGK